MAKIDRELVKTLQEFSRGWTQKREKAFAGLDFEALREELAQIKDQAIEQSDELLDKFIVRATARGSHVHLASDSRQANEIIYQILKEHGVDVLVKGKSMVSEETGLNDYLKKRGLEARETDLGEWIIQLEEEAPTHMVMPAIHLNREQVAEIFRNRLGEQMQDDIGKLVKVARRHVRKKILAAGAGLSGANALLAEEGAMLLVTNEGNGRLVTSVPPLLIVLTSWEKVLPSLRQALVLLRVLTRNATGQEISSYVSIIAGPPHEEQHIVIVDNNRSQLKEDEEFRKVLRCIKCSACLNVCPVYQMVGGQEFSYVYMGGIGSLLTAWVHGLKQSAELASYCLSCHRCDEVCSTKIPIADLVRKLRRRIVREEGGKLWKKAAFDFVLSRPGVEKKIFALGRAVRLLISKEGKMNIPLRVGVLDRLNKFPAPAEKSFSAMLEKDNEKFQQQVSLSSLKPEQLEVSGKRVAIFPGCLIENFFPGAGLAAYRLLRHSGFEVEVPFTGCCGFPAANSGFTEEARKEFKKVEAALLSGDYYRIITLCPTCTSMLRDLGPELIGDEEKKGVFKERVRTFVSFVAEEKLPIGEAGVGRMISEQIEAEVHLGTGPLSEGAISGLNQEGPDWLKEDKTRKADFKGEEEVSVKKRKTLEKEKFLKLKLLQDRKRAEQASAEASLSEETELRAQPDKKAKIKITYHDSCHHKFVLKESQLSRVLLKKAGYELVEMENSDFCCGFAGVFSVEQAAVSEELMRQKLEAIVKSGADLVVMDCPGCILQIKGGLLASKKQIEVKHTSELVK